MEVLVQDATATVEGQGHVVVVGELDALGCSTVKPVLLDALEQARDQAGGAEGGRWLVVDLCGVGFVASSALALMLELHAKATAATVGVRFVVAGGSAVDRQLQRTGVDAMLLIDPPGHACRRRLNTDQVLTTGS